MMNGDIKIVVLKGVMVLIGQVIRNDSEHITLKKPVSIMNKIADGEMTYSYAPYLEFTDDYFDGMQFKYDDIMNVCDPISQMRLEYIEAYVED